MHASSPIIGTPLHVACADNIPHRLEILWQLLEKGADPNAITPSEDGSPLRPPLAEYLASNEKPSRTVIQVLLKFGARVCIQNKIALNTLEIPYYEKQSA